MKLKRFTAPTMTEAIKLIKNDLGKDAIILSTRKIKQQNGQTGLEITAAVDSTPPQRSTAPQPKHPTHLHPLETTGQSNAINSTVFGQLTLHGVLPAYANRIAKAVMALQETGFSEEDGLEMVLSKMLNFSTPQTVLGGKKPILFLGPTGAGKTTTLAKIAVSEKAHRQRVSLLSFDTYKIGGAEQLRIYADALGAPLTILSKALPLKQALEAHKTADLILIDSAGTNPYEPSRLYDLQKNLQGVNTTTALVLPCNMHAAEMQALPQAFAPFKPDHLIFTKMDESTFIGGLINTGISSALPLCFVADGQRVPQDLLQIDAKSLGRKLLTKPNIPWQEEGTFDERTA